MRRRNPASGPVISDWQEREFAVRAALEETPEWQGYLNQHPGIVAAAESPAGQRLMTRFPEPLLLPPGSVYNVFVSCDFDLRFTEWSIVAKWFDDHLFSMSMTTAQILLNKNWSLPGHQWYWDQVPGSQSHHKVAGVYSFSIGVSPWQWKRDPIVGIGGAYDSAYGLGWDDENDTRMIVEIAQMDNIGGDDALVVLKEEIDGYRETWLHQDQNQALCAQELLDPDMAFGRWREGYLKSAMRRVGAINLNRRRDIDVHDNPKSMMTGPGWDAARQKLRGAAQGTRKNSPIKNPNDDTRKAAVDKYEEFHRLEPTKIAEFSLTIPSKVKKLGKAMHTLYESGKKDPETLRKPKKPLAYIHDHDAGVHIYKCEGSGDTQVPDFIKHAQALVVLGKCLGFAWKDDGGEHEAEGTNPLPDLCCTVDGRALLVVQSRRTVLAMIWGGALGVEARGIVG